MKHLVIASFVLSLIFTSCSDVKASQVPSVVLNAFKAKYPTAADVEWEKAGGNYEVDFEIQGVDYTALFTRDGKFIKQKKDISVAELPSAISSMLKSKFSNYVPEDAELVEQGGRKYYQVELEGGTKRDKNLVLLENGSEQAKTAYWH